MTDTKKVLQPSLNKLRKDKFTLVITIPNILKDLNSKNIRENDFFNLDSLQFSVYNINIPSSSIPEHPLHIYGQNYNVTSYDRPPYEPCTVNFQVDNEFNNYWVIWKWLQLINDPILSRYASKNILENGAPKTIPEQYNYQTDIVAFGKDEYNNDKVRFTFKYAFPTILGELDYNYRDPEQLETYFKFVFNQLDITLLPEI